MAKQVRGKSRPRRNNPRRSGKPQKFFRQHPLWSPPEFRPDVQGTGFLKYFRFTRLQRLQLLKWLLYTAVCVLCLVIQDSVMSTFTIFGSTTDLAAGILLLITVMEGSEVGSIFILIASILYYFSGSAPGAYTVGLLTVLGVLTTVLRQQLWHRSIGSIVLCAGMALTAYEIGLYFVGLFLGLTRWARLPAFAVTAALTVLVMIPEYHLIDRIGQIGGSTWKE